MNKTNFSKEKTEKKRKVRVKNYENSEEMLGKVKVRLTGQTRIKEERDFFIENREFGEREVLLKRVYAEFCKNRVFGFSR